MFNLFKKKQPQVSPDYQKWHEFILSLKPTAPLAGIPDEVYGILMDVGMGGGPGQYLAISVYALNTGEASLRASTGAGVIGIGDAKEISGLPEEIVRRGQSLVGLTSPAKEFKYPEANKVLFYFLTISGVRVYECELRDLTQAHPFGELFYKFSTIKSFADRIVDESGKK